MPNRLIPTDHITGAIRVIRGQRVLLDADLAKLYDVETRVLNQAVRRNSERFPDDFMFQLTSDEDARLRSQIVILDAARGRHRKFLPYAFTEQGVAMLSGVLHSPRAVSVNVEIMRAFVQLRRTPPAAPQQASQKLRTAGGGVVAIPATPDALLP
mgnify:CR=1 FL=1